MKSKKISIELRNRMEKIVEGLSIGFGGKSQISLKVLGKALAGNINNNGLDIFGDVNDLVFELMDVFVFEDENIRDYYIKIYDSCIKSLKKLNFPYERLPFEPANPKEFED